MSWDEIKGAVNSTLGTDEFLPLDKMIIQYFGSVNNRLNNVDKQLQEVDTEKITEKFIELDNEIDVLETDISTINKKIQSQQASGTIVFESGQTVLEKTHSVAGGVALGIYVVTIHPYSGTSAFVGDGFTHLTQFSAYRSSDIFELKFFNSDGEEEVWNIEFTPSKLIISRNSDFANQTSVYFYITKLLY